MGFEERRLDLNILVADAWRIQDAVVKMELVQTDKRLYASRFFCLIVQHATILEMLLQFPKYKPKNLESCELELWPFASVCSLLRALIEATLVFCHLFSYDIPDEEADFRFLYWKTTANKNRVRFLTNVGSEGERLNTLKALNAKEIETLKEHPLFQGLEGKSSRPYRQLKKDFLKPIKTMAVEAGISEKYYDSLYGYLSSYAHANSYAIDQLSAFKPGDPASLQLMSPISEYALMFLGLGITTFCMIFPEMETHLTDESKKIIRLWLNLAKNWDEWVEHSRDHRRATKGQDELS